jgi:uncharacterized membrane protein
MQSPYVVLLIILFPLFLIVLVFGGALAGGAEGAKVLISVCGRVFL